MASSPEIRRFQERDGADVIDLWTRVFGYGTAHNDPALVIERKMARQPELFFVAVIDQKVVGTVMGGYDGHRGWIYAMAVSPEVRGVGIASALLGHLETALRALGCLKINLQVREDNAGVVEFYRKQGYVVEPRISMGKVL